MAGPWYTAAQLLEDVGQILKKDAEELQDYWLPLCEKAADTAYADLSDILIGKGYTMTQLDAWDFRATYSRQQALFWLYTETALGIGYDDKEINKLDRRDRLEKSATILINKTAVGPDTGTDNTAAGIGGGVISEDGYRITGSTEF